MIQASLLTTTDIPDNDLALQKWAERIRSRIMSLTKQVASLEEEKRTLLIKLQEASMSTMEMDIDRPPNAVSPGATVSYFESVVECVHDSGPVSIVDLVQSSQSVSDAGNTDLIMDNNWQPDEAVCPEVEVDSPFPDEVDSFLGKLDPRELNFDASPRMMENSPPPNITGASSEKRRLYKVSEFLDVDWDEVTSGELKQWLQFFGLKPALGGRKVMVEKLGQIFKYISGCTADDYLKPPDDHLSARHQLFAKFRNLIVSNPEIYEKIVCFESIDIGEVFQYLGDSITDKTFSVKHVKEYLDQINVQYSTTSEKFSKKRVVSRKPRTVRKSISCPM